MTAIAPVVVT